MEDYKMGMISIPYRLDRKLYKYYSNIDNAIRNLENRRIHLDSVKAFNDPFEALFLNRKDAIWETGGTLKAIFIDVATNIAMSGCMEKNDKYRKIFNYIMSFVNNSHIALDESRYSLKEGLQKIYNISVPADFSFEDLCDLVEEVFFIKKPFVRVDCKISCFSEVNDSILMWSYYADKHKGICVEYDLSLLDLNLPFNRKIYESIARVHYSKQRINDELNFPIEDTYLNLLLTKADVWSHEHEWRLICETQEEFMPLSCVSGVYLGANFEMDSNIYNKLIEVVNTYDNLKIYKSSLDLNEYKLNFEEVYNSYVHHMLKYHRSERFGG